MASLRRQKSEDQLYFSRREGFYSFAKRTQSIHDFKQFFFYIKTDPELPRFPTAWNEGIPPPLPLKWLDVDNRIGILSRLIPERWTLASAVWAYLENVPLVTWNGPDFDYLDVNLDIPGKFFTLAFDYFQHGFVPFGLTSYGSISSAGKRHQAGERAE